jgi:hypothetical protein
MRAARVFAGIVQILVFRSSGICEMARGVLSALVDHSLITR